MPHLEPKPAERPLKKPDSPERPTKGLHSHERPHRPSISRKFILMAAVIFAALLLIFFLADPAGFRERMILATENAAKMEQHHQQMQERPVPTPLRTDPGTTPPPPGIQTAAPEKTEKPALTEEPQKEAADQSALEVYLIDVGQADSIFLRSPKGKTMLVDSGESQNFDAVCKFLDAEGVSKLDVVVATHPHNDHIGSMYRILRKYDVGKFYMPAVTHNTATYERMLDALEEKGISPRIAYAKPNAKIAWGDGSVTARILSPFEGIDYDMNNWSIVLHVSFDETSILLTADAEEHAESVMLANLSAEELDADVLKLGHHGSSTSTTEAFLDAVSPEIAVISVGKGNDYNHPHAETLKRLKKRDIDVYRTDKNGIITVILDGEDVTVKTEKKK